jgi:poly-gamma-glutamate capsule biosynthesis protein CapA/YwtB (metallophosphatase superfamily)
MVECSPTRRTVLTALSPVLGGCLGVQAPTADVERRSPVTLSGVDEAELGFVGDVMLGRGVDERWRDRDPAGVWGSLRDRITALDGLFVNLECCLSTRGERWPEKTYYFRGDPEWAVPALSAADTTWASLANNHALDFGDTALADTREALDSAGIAHAGAGPDWDRAIEPSLVSTGPLDVAVIGLTERWAEYRAGEHSPGTAYLPLTVEQSSTRSTVRRVLAEAQAADPDLVVASLHWGPNWTEFPEPKHREFGRWLVEQGVDVVHGHSAHVVQGIEVHQGRPILYDTGDFVDDYSVKPAIRNDRTFLFVLEIEDERLDAVRLDPVEIDDKTVHSASDEATAWLHEEMPRRQDPFEATLRTDGRSLRVPIE